MLRTVTKIYTYNPLSFGRKAIEQLVPFLVRATLSNNCLRAHTCVTGTQRVTENILKVADSWRQLVHEPFHHFVGLDNSFLFVDALRITHL